MLRGTRRRGYALFEWNAYSLYECRSRAMMRLYSYSSWGSITDGNALALCRTDIEYSCVSSADNQVTNRSYDY